jgi:hypothetical protein
MIETLGSDRQHLHPDELDALRRRLRARARHCSYYVHPSLLEHVRSHPSVVLGGRDAAAHAGTPIDPAAIDAYIPDTHVDDLVRSLHARPDIINANVHLHAVDDHAWPFNNEQRFTEPWVAWLDLQDRHDRAADTLLDRPLGGRFTA